MGLTGETGVPDLPIIKAASTSTVTISVLEIFSSYKCQINKLTNSLFYYSRFTYELTLAVYVVKKVKM